MPDLIVAADGLAAPAKRAGVFARLPSGRQANQAFAWVFGFSLAVRLAALAMARHIRFVSDGHDYVEMARMLWSGQHFIPYWPPGLPLYLVPWVAAGASDVAIRASMLLFWMATTWGIFRLMRAAGVGDFAWLILLLFAVMPSAIQMSIEPVTQQPVAALLVIALSAALECGRGAGLGEYALLGCSLGSMAPLRPSALPLLLLPVACLLHSRRVGWLHKLTGPALSIALGTLLLGAWVVRTHATTGAWMINNSNAVNFYFGNNPWTPVYRTWYFGSKAKVGTAEIHNFPEYERIVTRTSSLPPLQASGEFKRLAMDHITQRPGLFLLRTVNRMRCFFGFDTYTSANLRSDGKLARRLFPISLALEAVLYLAIAGPAFFWLAVAPAGFWREWGTWVILGSILIYAAPYWISMSHPTYHYPIMIPLGVLGVLAWKASQTSVGALRRGWIAVVVLALIQVEWVWQMAHA